MPQFKDRTPMTKPQEEEFVTIEEEVEVYEEVEVPVENRSDTMKNSKNEVADQNGEFMDGEEEGTVHQRAPKDPLDFLVISASNDKLISRLLTRLAVLADAKCRHYGEIWSWANYVLNSKIINNYRNQLKDIISMCKPQCGIYAGLKLMIRTNFVPSPCIRGMRIRVTDVLDLLASGLASDQVLRELPDLELEDIQACLRFASRRIDHPIVAR
jgi:uncharacterized protein (DUF433 family)